MAASDRLIVLYHARSATATTRMWLFCKIPVKMTPPDVDAPDNGGHLVWQRGGMSPDAATGG